MGYNGNKTPRSQVFKVRKGCDVLREIDLKEMNLAKRAFINQKPRQQDINLVHTCVTL